MNLLFDEVAKFQASRGLPFSIEMIRRFMIDNIELPEIIEYKNIPRLAPLFPSMWFEWREAHVHSQFGLHLISTQGIDGWDYTALGWISSKTYRKGPKLQPYAMKFHIPVSGRINFFECQSFPIKPETHVLVRSSSMSVEEYMNAFVAAYMTKVLFAIGLLHCKNIVQIEKGGKNPNVTHRRQRSKGTKHYILDVVPARNIKRTEYEHPLKGLRREYISGADISRNTPPKNPCLESTPGHSGGKRMLLAARTSVKSRRITAFFQCSSNSSAGYSASFFRFTTNESGKVARSLYRDFASPFR